MADHVHREEVVGGAPPLTSDAFIADRQRFWSTFTRFVTGCTAAVVVVLVLLALFLL